MKETIYCFYLIADSQERVGFLGHIRYDVDGTEEDKLAYLKVAAERDYEKATLTKAPMGLTIGAYTARCRLGTALELFEHVFEPQETRTPLYGITIILDGKPSINYVSDHGPLDMADVNKELGAKSVMDDWLAKYTKDNIFHYADLINDDFLLAYKLLYNNRHYASAAKLFMSCIDSIAHVEYGYDKKPSERAVFSRWLDAYVDLKPVGVTADELWELRNGMLHMSNLDSNKVLKKKLDEFQSRLGTFQRKHKAHSTIYIISTYIYFILLCATG